MRALSFTAAAAIVVSAHGHPAATHAQAGNSPPVVKITQPLETQVLRWGTPFRYAITVSDREDGASASGEIPAYKVLLEVEFRRSGAPDEAPRHPAEMAGLDVLRTSNCFTCHADKTSLVGPSFSAIAERHGPDPEALRRLSGHIRSGSSGLWGATPMPPHADLSEDEALAAARFILGQGSQPNRWVYAGVEGVIRIVPTPAGEGGGTYTLTASYLDNGLGGAGTTRLRGAHLLTFAIQ